MKQNIKKFQNNNDISKQLKSKQFRQKMYNFCYLNLFNIKQSKYILLEKIET